MHALEKKSYLTSIRFCLENLVDPVRRCQRLNGMEVFSESACFHRRRDLIWPREEHVERMRKYFTEEQMKAFEDFERVFHSLPWKPIPSHPHISELPDDDLTELIRAGKRLMRLVKE